MGQHWPTWGSTGPSGTPPVPRRAAVGWGSLCAPRLCCGRQGAPSSGATAAAASNKGRLFAGWASGSSSPSPRAFLRLAAGGVPLLWYFHTHTSLCLRLSPSHIPPALWIPCAKAAPSLPQKHGRHTHTPGTAAPHPLEPHKMENPQEPGVTPLCKILERLVCWPSSPQAGVR